MKQRYQPITPADMDAIPRSVALGLLTDPKAKLSARMRKNCFAALDKVFVSAHTIRRIDYVMEGEELSTRKLCFDTECTPKPAASRIAGKLRSVPWVRLNRLWSRVQRRINGLTFKRTRVMFGSLVMHESQRNKIMIALNGRLAQLEVVRDCATTEINRRVGI